MPQLACPRPPEKQCLWKRGHRWWRYNTIWGTLGIITKTRAVAADPGPRRVSLLPSFLFSSVSTKQKGPRTVHETWLGLPHAACVDA